MSLNACWFKSPAENLQRLQQATGRIRLYGVAGQTIVLHLNGEGPIAFEVGARNHAFAPLQHRTELYARRVDLDCIDVPKHTIADVRFTREVVKKTTTVVCCMRDEADNHLWLSFGFNSSHFHFTPKLSVPFYAARAAEAAILRSPL